MKYDRADQDFHGPEVTPTPLRDSGIVGIACMILSYLFFSAILNQRTTMDEDFKFPAVYMAHTPSGPIYTCADHAVYMAYTCADHAIKITALLSFMGAYVVLTPAPDGSQCCNCVNEAKKGRP